MPLWWGEPRARPLLLVDAGIQAIVDVLIRVGDKIR